MKKILLDENIPKRLSDKIKQNSEYMAVHIDDIKKGLPDDNVYEIARDENMIIITDDNDFKKRKYRKNISIVWLTDKARRNIDTVEKIFWIIENIEFLVDYDSEYFFVTITADSYVIENKKSSNFLKKNNTFRILFSSLNDWNNKIKNNLLLK